MTRLATKLVRDKIPGNRLAVSTQEHFTLLLAKLHEETEEVARTGTLGELEEEIGDVLEVLTSIAAITGIDWSVLNASRMRKKAEKGGFLAGVVQDNSEAYSLLADSK